MSNRFEWDDQKADANLKKHGISFKMATTVFDDDYRVESYDYKHSTLNEARYKVVGRMNGTLTILTIIYTKRDRIRIISARLATKREEEAYYNDGEL